MHNFGTCIWRTAQWRLPEKQVFRCIKNRILSLRCGSPNASPEVVYRPRSESLLHFDTKLGTCSKFAWKNNFLALGVCFPQPCSSACRVSAWGVWAIQPVRIKLNWTEGTKMRIELNWTECYNNTSVQFSSILPPAWCVGTPWYWVFVSRCTRCKPV